MGRPQRPALMSPALDAVRLRTRELKRSECRNDQRRDALIAAIVMALAAGERPTDVTNASPFSAAYVRRLAKAAGIPPATRSSQRGNAR